MKKFTDSQFNAMCDLSDSTLPDLQVDSYAISEVLKDFSISKRENAVLTQKQKARVASAKKKFAAALKLVLQANEQIDLVIDQLEASLDRAEMN